MISVMLTGSAITGIHQPTRALAMALPRQVCLGRIRESARPQALNFSNYIDLPSAAGSLPTSINRRDKAAASIARMYLNDRYGDCVIAGKAHMLGVWSANDDDSPGIVLATDQEILAQYKSVCGPNDQGCIITSVLDYMKAQGMVCGGQRYKIDGYVAVDWTSPDVVKTVQYLFAASPIGINLPQAWTTSAIWDVTNTRIVGGHDVTVIDYDENGVYVASWGRIYLITWRAFTSTKWIEEMYAILGPLWYGANKRTITGFDASSLANDLVKLGRGEIPPIDPNPPVPPGPNPPVPPEPPNPPSPTSGVVTTIVDAEAKTVHLTMPQGWTQIMSAAAMYEAGPSVLDYQETTPMLDQSVLQKAGEQLATVLPEDHTHMAAAQGGLVSAVQALIAAVQAGDMNLIISSLIDLLTIVRGPQAEMHRQMSAAAGFNWQALIQAIITLLPLIFGTN